jgi:hypothetical protein
LIKNVLTELNGLNICDLILSDVIIILSFYINIILKARLIKAGVWYSGANAILRISIVDNSFIVKQLKRKGNLIFFKYKLFNYSTAFNMQRALLILLIFLIIV